MAKVILILVFPVLILLNGCVTMEWVNQNKPKDALYEDKLACEELANRLAWQRYPQPAPITIHNTKVDTTVQVGQTVYPDSLYGKPEEPKDVLPEDPYIYNRRDYREECLTDCLHSKGWFLQEVKQGGAVNK